MALRGDSTALAAQIAAAREVFARHASCLILSHAGGDGDSHGAQLALALTLENLGLRVACYNGTGVPESCRFLPTATRIVPVLPPEIPSLAIVVDANTLHRCRLTPAQLTGCREYLRVDHHVTQRAEVPFLPVVDPHATSTCEVAYHLLRGLGQPLTPDLATCLLAGLMTDTSRFATDTVDTEAFALAAVLIQAGARHTEIIEHFWERRRRQAISVLGIALSHVTLSCAGKLAWTHLHYENFTRTGARPEEDTDGIIEHVRTISGVRLAALFTEKRDVVHVSLRAEEIDVAELARAFGGGGHPEAAGMRCLGNLEEVVARVLPVLEAAVTAPRPEEYAESPLDS